MLLVIDIGNTNITLAVATDGSLRAARRATTRASATSDELELLLVDLIGLDDLALADVDAIAVASVVPALTARSRQVARRRGIAAPDRRAGHGPARDPGGPPGRGRGRPARERPRRLRGCTGHRPSSWTRHGHDLRLRRARTAPTSAERSRPGLELGLEALAARTAKLPRIELRTPGPRDRPRHRRARCRPAPCSATRRSSRACSAGSGDELAERSAAGGGRAHDPHRRPVGGTVGARRRGRGHDRPGPDPRGPRASSTPRSPAASPIESRRR